MPMFTNYTESFKGTLDHIFFNKDRLEVTHLLETPDVASVARDRGLPSILYPSDHIRIEAIF